MRPRRLVHGLLLWVTLVLAGCLRVKTGAPAHGDASRESPTRRGTILVLMPATPPAESVWEGLRGELSSEFGLTPERLPADASVGALAEAIERARPACLVLMNNATVRLYWQYQQSLPSVATFPPAVIVMSSFLQQTYKSIKNATGISYEVPGVAQFVRLRSIVDRPIRKVGVVYRAQFAEFVSAQQKLARPEEFELVGQELSREPTRDEVTSAIASLLQNERVDAFWVLNDNTLLTPELINGAWLPSLGATEAIPVIVGVRSLLDKRHDLGSFAMLPDHAALGVQAANLVLDIADNGWRIGQHKVELPISMKTVVDVEQVRRQFGFRKGGLDKIDQIVE